MSKLLGSFMFSAFVFAACGGGGGGGGSVASVIDDQSTIICDQAFTCMAEYPADAPIAFEQFFGTSEAQCKTTFSMAFDAADVQASVDAGRIDFSASAANACNDFVAGLSCAEFWGSLFDDNPPEPAVCDQAFVGKVADGGMCLTSLDCAGADSFCDETTMTCDGGGV